MPPGWWHRSPGGPVHEVHRPPSGQLELRRAFHCLHKGVVRSIVLYGAPTWSKDSACSSRCKAQLRSLQRLMAMRIVRGYCTIWYEAATVLARSPPFDIPADMDTMVQDQIRSVERQLWTMSPECSGRTRIRRIYSLGGHGTKFKAVLALSEAFCRASKHGYDGLTVSSTDLLWYSPGEKKNTFLSAPHVLDFGKYI